MKFINESNMWKFISRTKVVSPEQAKFRHLVEFSEQVAATNPAALVDLARLYLRPLQAAALISCPESALHGAARGMTPDKIFMQNGPFALTGHWNYPSLDPKDFLVDLARDPVLTFPWHRDRYVSAFAHIGKGKKFGDWRQDPNHGICLILPWGIPFVFGGNHSIAAGILGAQGVIYPVEVYDMGGILDAVSCDGRNYVDVATQRPVDKVRDYRMAALFELGRLMRDHVVVPMRIST